MTLNAIWELCADTTFESQVRVAAVQYAATALAASSTLHGAADQKKWALAASTLVDGGVANQTRFVWAIATSGAGTFALDDTADANDALIASAMINMWPKIAGVTAADTGG